jgi:hypothetical protein
MLAGKRNSCLFGLDQKRSATVPRILLFVLLVIFSVSSVGAQEASGPTAERVKKEIMQLEQEKIKALLSTTSTKNYAAEWFDRVYVDDIDHSSATGTVKDKAQLVAEFRTGNHRTYRDDQYNWHIRVYGDGNNGTTVVVNYVASSDVERNGHRAANTDACSDVFVKLNGAWRMVLHQVTPLPNAQAN